MLRSTRKRGAQLLAVRRSTPVTYQCMRVASQGRDAGSLAKTGQNHGVALGRETGSTQRMVPPAGHGACAVGQRVPCHDCHATLTVQGKLHPRSHSPCNQRGAVHAKSDAWAAGIRPCLHPDPACACNAKHARVPAPHHAHAHGFISVTTRQTVCSVRQNAPWKAKPPSCRRNGQPKKITRDANKVDTVDAI